MTGLLLVGVVIAPVGSVGAPTKESGAHTAKKKKKKACRAASTAKKKKKATCPAKPKPTAAASGGSPSTPTTPPDPPPSKNAFELIDSEYEAGKITLGEALLYKFYAESNDPRLPERFGSAPPDPFDLGFVTKQAATYFASLPAADQTAIEPFFRPPIYDGAIFADRLAAGDCSGGSGEPAVAAGWDSLTTTHFRIHYYTVKPDEGAAEPARSLEVAQQVEAIAEYVYGKETPVFGAPLSDAGLPCNGGDDKIDIYASKMRQGKVAQVLPYLPGGEARPGWMFINPGSAGAATVKDVRDVFAHEFAHLSQLRVDYFVDPGPTGINLEYGWIEEGTATWAMNDAYPNDNYEWRWLPSYFGNLAWHTPLGEGARFGDENGYRDWLFFLYLTKDDNSTAAITAIFNAAQSKASVGALNQALGGHFPQRWRDYALHLMNRENYNQFAQWDGITNRLPMGSAVNGGDQNLTLGLNGNQSRELPLPFTNNRPLAFDPEVSIDPKAFSYTSFELPDPEVKKLTFKGYGYRPDSSPDGSTRITAWFKRADGTYGLQDWSDGADRKFCRDDPDQNLSELVLFYTHGRPTPYLEQGGSVEHPLYQQGKVELKDACDWPAYDGTFSGTSVLHDDPVFTPARTTEFEGTIRLEPVQPEAGLGDVNWQPVSGSLHVESVSGTWDGCSVASGGTTVGLPAFSQDGVTYLSSFLSDNSPPQFDVLAFWPEAETISVQLTCPPAHASTYGSGTHDIPLYHFGQALFYSPDLVAPQANGNIVATEHVTEDPSWTHDYTYSLVPDYTYTPTP